jgi:hypothetical protein
VLGVTLYTVGKRATAGRNPLVFKRLLRGEQIKPETAAVCAAWFPAHWPPHVIWPAGVPLHGSPSCQAAE